MTIYRKIFLRPVFIFFGLIFIIAFTSCHEEKIDPDKYVIPRMIQVAREGEQIKIGIYSILALYNSTNLYIPNAVSAERCELFVSEKDTLDYKSLGEIDVEQTDYFYSKNTIEKKYFFKLKCYAKGANPTYSNVAWIIGGVNEGLEILVDAGDDNTLQFCDVSEDESKILYAKNAGELCCDNISLYMKDLSNVTDEFLITGEHGSFFSTGLDLAFVSHFGIMTTPQPTNLGILDIQPKESIQLTDGDNVIQFPAWSESGNNIYYLNVDNVYSNPWNLQKYQVENETSETLISSDEMIITNQPISVNENKIYFTAYQDTGEEGIYVYNIDNKTVNTIEQTMWNEYGPAISHDGKKLAFLTNRSGRDEIWVKELITGNYLQVTADFEGYPQGKIAWSANDEYLYFKGYYNEKNAIIKVLFKNE